MKYILFLKVNCSFLYFGAPERALRRAGLRPFARFRIARTGKPR